MLIFNFSGARVFYSDTDSIIYDIENNPDLIKKIDEEFSMGSPAYNAYKHECSTPITSFASLGAKNYSYETEGGEQVVKSRGFSLESLIAESRINHEIMKDLLVKYLKGEEAEVKCPTFKMIVNRQKATIRNSSVNKKYSNNVFDKRIVLTETSTACTLPFGLKSHDFSDCKKENGLS